MHKKLINGRWYSNIYDPKSPGKKLTISLDAYEKEKRKATQAIGVILRDIEMGIRPMSAGTKICKLKIQGRVTVRTAQILETHIIPFFGHYKPVDIDEKLIADYIEHRYGRTADGGLQGYFNTIDKELLTLQRLLQHKFGRGYRRPQVPYERLKKETLRPLTIPEIKSIADFVSDKYVVIYWIMAYTAMDISDVVYLKPSEIVSGWIKKVRGKTSKKINVPICPALADLMKPIPWPIDKNDRLFPDVTPDAVSTNVRRACDKAGLPGYGAKYLRRFVASILMDQGNSITWIQKVLSHAEGSSETDLYLQVYQETAEREFNKIQYGEMK